MECGRMAVWCCGTGRRPSVRLVKKQEIQLGQRSLGRPGGDGNQYLPSATPACDIALFAHAWVLPLLGCVISGKLPNYSEPHVSHLSEKGIGVGALEDPFCPRII